MYLIGHHHGGGYGHHHGGHGGYGGYGKISYIFSCSLVENNDFCLQAMAVIINITANKIEHKREKYENVCNVNETRALSMQSVLFLHSPLLSTTSVTQKPVPLHFACVF